MPTTANLPPGMMPMRSANFFSNAQLVGGYDYCHPRLGPFLDNVFHHAGMLRVQPIIGSSITKTSGSCSNAETMGPPMRE